MLNQIEKQKTKPTNKNDRMSLSKETSERIAGWLDEVNSLLPGYRIGKSDLINWLISKKPEKLAEPELKELKEQFFDPLKAMKWATDQLKSAKSKGEQMDLSKLLVENMLIAKPSKPKTLKVKKPQIKDEIGEKLCDKLL